MSENPPKHWQELWEDGAEEERKRLSSAEIEQLLQDARKGNYGNYYTIWYVIADHATLEQAGWTLYKVLTADVDYLYRYHAAAGLIQLLGDTHFQPVDLSGNSIAVQTNLPEVRKMLIQKIGEPPAGI